MHADGGVGSTVLNSGRTCAPHVAEGNESSAKARGSCAPACMHVGWTARQDGSRRAAEVRFSRGRSCQGRGREGGKERGVVAVARMGNGPQTEGMGMEHHEEECVRT